MLLQEERDQLLGMPATQSLAQHPRMTHIQQHHMRETPPGSPTIAAHHMPPLSPIELQAPVAPPMPAAAAQPRVKPQSICLPPTPTEAQPYLASSAQPAADLSPSPLGFRRKEANAETDGVSLWGDSTIAANARSEGSPGLSQRHWGGYESSPDAFRAAHHSSGGFQPPANNGQYSPGPEDAADWQIPSKLPPLHVEASPERYMSGDTAPGSGGRTPKRSFNNYLKGQGSSGQPRAAVKPVSHPETYLPSPSGQYHQGDEITQLHATDSPREALGEQKFRQRRQQHLGAASHATIDWVRQSSAALEADHHAAGESAVG